MSPVDLVLVEGFKTWEMPKLEVHRPSVGKPLLAPGDPTILALASDEPLATSLPCFALTDAEAIAGFICRQLGLGR
jgi:molybdopterin-guanine dinucleotide biosynthesis protein MobB